MIGGSYVYIRALYRNGDRRQSRRYPYGVISNQKKLSRRFFPSARLLSVYVLIDKRLHFVQAFYHIPRQNEVTFRARQILI